MNAPILDEVVRQAAQTAGKTVSRREVLGAAVAGTVALATAGLATRSAAGDAASAQIAATPASGFGSRRPDAPTVAQQAAALGADVTAIFRFVAEQVHYEAYPGGLRGATGTLWGMAGNSVDQALLLAALLRAGGIKTRFAIGSLPDADAARLLQAMQTDHARDTRVLMPPASPAASPSNLTPDQQALLASLPAQRQKLIDTARADLSSTVRTIQSGLASVGITLPLARPELPALERTSHVWVQYDHGGAWVDLDPSFAGSQPGKAVARATATPAALPAELFHQIAIRLTVEIVTGGQPVRSDALTYQALAQDLVAVPLTLVQAPPQITGQAAVATGAQPYIPTLVVGSQGVTGKPFALATGGGLTSLGGLGGPVEGDTLAEWLNIDLIAPGGQSQRFTREIFDRVGAAQRASGQVDISSVPPATLTQIGTLGQFYLPLLGIISIAVVGEKVPWTYFQQDYKVNDRLADMTNVSHGYHYVRDVLMLETEADTGYRFYPDAPNVTTVTLLPTTIAADSATISAGIDIISRSAAAVPQAGHAPAMPAPVAAGVLAHLAERTMAEGGAGQVKDGPPISSIGVGRVFAEAAKQGIPIRTLPPQRAIPADIALTDLARSEIATALKAGNVVIVPARAVTLDGAMATGWWRVDPHTGGTVDQMEGGKGQEETEYVSLLSEVFQSILEAEHLGWCLVGFMAAASLVIAIIGGASSSTIGLATLGTVKGGLACAVQIVGNNYISGP